MRVAGQGACGAGAAHACTHGQHVSWPRGVGNPTLTRPGRLRAIFNILCEQPETVAAFLVPRVRTVAARREAGRYIRYLTAWRALERFLTAPLHANRFFDGAGAVAGAPP